MISYLQVPTFLMYSVFMDTKAMQICEEKTAAAFACPIENTLKVMDGKWKIMILHALFFNGTLRFSELKKHIPGVTQKMLTAQLRDLEAKGVVERKVYPVVPPKVEYSLTDMGRSLRPVLEAMHQWSLEYDPRPCDVELPIAV
jgi:DNA-binding HxlR family transcriptional regulator